MFLVMEALEFIQSFNINMNACRSNMEKKAFRDKQMTDAFLYRERTTIVGSAKDIQKRLKSPELKQAVAGYASAFAKNIRALNNLFSLYNTVRPCDYSLFRC